MTPKLRETRELLGWDGWLTEFYPIPAHAFVIKHGRDCYTPLVKHSLQKWRGALRGNLNRYNQEIHRRDGDVVPYIGPPGHELIFDNISCSLCLAYLKQPFLKSRPPDCSACPIFKVRGAPCDAAINQELASPFMAWVGFADPGPMIELLERTLEWAEAENAKTESRGKE